jgi:cell division septum initiation protein DivIVA
MRRRSLMPDQSSAATEHAILQEITRPLAALPDDPLSVVDAEFPTALRGYERVAVDEYVRRTRQLVAELQATRSPESAVRRALERVGEEITGILQRAHETAEQITAQSRGEADDRLEQARQEAAQVAAAAEQRVRDLDADTDRIWLERQRIVGDAEELAAQLVQLAKTAADRFPADAGGEGPDAEPGYDEHQSPPQEAFFAAEEEDEEYGDEAAYHDAESDEAGDVTETVAFQPPPNAPPADAPSDAEGPEATDGPTAGREAPQEADRDPTAERDPAAQDATSDGPPASDDTTAVIPPASQAASRRLSQ